jgi:sugar lactone lactonase YvrE
MSWTVEYDAELGVVQGTYVGRVTADEFKEATIKAIGLAKDNNTNLFLIFNGNGIRFFNSDV